MSSVRPESDFLLPSHFVVDCELDSNRYIKNLDLNNLSIFKNEKLIAPNLNKNEISSQKQGLENAFIENKTGYTKFRIENKNGKLVLKPQTLIPKIISKITPFYQPVELSAPTAKKVTDFCTQIENKNHSNAIFSKVKTHNITLLENVPKTNRKLTALFLGLIVVGFLSGVIGVGAFLPQIGAITPSMGIVGIPLDLSVALISVGLATIASVVIFKIASKKSFVANEYLKDILKMKGQLFLEGNSNDLTGFCLFLLLALSIKFTGVDTLKACLAYPTGILLMMSAIYQGIQSIKNINNSKLTKDKELFIKSILSSCFSISLFTLGFLITIGMTNTLPQIIFAFCTGTTSSLLACFGMKKSYELLKKLNKVDPNNAQSIISFLQNNLNLTDSEIEKIKTSVSKFKNEDILNWIKNNKKNWDVKQQKIWEEIFEKLQKEKDIELDEIKKNIVNEEIKSAIERKLDSFRSLVKEDTYKKTVSKLDDFKNNLKTNEKELIELFAKIKNEITLKTFVEFVKFFFLFLPYMIVPFFKMNGLLNIRVYDAIIAFLNLLTLSINSTPRFRNIPPAIEKKPLDINAQLDAYKTLKIKTNKAKTVALKKLKVPQPQKDLASA